MRIRSILKITTILAISFLLTQCTNKNKNSFTVTVNYTNADKLAQPVRILLEEIPYGGDNRPVLLDSATLPEKNGKIVLQGNGSEEAIYELMVQNGPVLLLVNDEQEIQVTIDLAKKDNYYTISGSPASAALQTFVENYGIKSIAANKAFDELDSLKKIGASDSLLLAATDIKNNAVKELNNYLTKFLSTSSHPAVSLFALGMSSRSFQKADFENKLNEVVKKFPDHKTLANLKTSYEMQQSQLAKQEETQKQDGSWIGKPAPDLSMPSANGDTISISSFKGRYVLVDFWASWCGPCREENPNVVAAYNKYKGKNFTVLGVSLDKSKEAWLKAVKDDKLEWPQMSDLAYWNSKAVDVYKFDGIPYNVLIDPKGIVIGEGLRGADLEKKLVEVLK